METSGIASRQARGGIITAKRLNVLIDKHNADARGGDISPDQGESTQVGIQRFMVTAVMDDHLECIAMDQVDGVDFIQDAPGLDKVLVMKPYKLRSSPFDGKTIGIEGTDITFTYVDALERSADDGTDTETQKITPSYDVRVDTDDGYRGDEILAIHVGITTGYKVALVDGETPKSVVVWHDMNTDGRAWAKE